MFSFTRRIAPFSIALSLLLISVSAVHAEIKWPSLVRYTLALSTSDEARYQTSLGVSGPITENLGAKVEGWWLAGEGKNRAFVGDAYLDYSKNELYVAAGRKYVMFGPVGVLVSPGITGAQVKYAGDRWELQALAGDISFTPGLGAERFNFFGVRSLGDERMSAARVVVQLTPPGAATPVKIGGNWLRVLDDTGTGFDAEIGLTKTLTLFGELADFNDAQGTVYGLRLSDAQIQTSEKGWILVIYHRDIELGFTPAIVGASAFVENQKGWYGGAYHQLNSRNAIGLYADKDDVILTWFGSIPL